MVDWKRKGIRRKDEKRWYIVREERREDKSPTKRRWKEGPGR